MLILPAWVEHQPRIALRALSAGIPVIATRACGLASHPLLTEIDQPDATAIKECIAKIFAISKAS
jgi:glycosyltransferase involved in cell wall biosynthesis